MLARVHTSKSDAITPESLTFTSYFRHSENDGNHTSITDSQDPHRTDINILPYLPYILFFQLSLLRKQDSCEIVKNNIKTPCTLYPVSHYGNIFQSHSTVSRAGNWHWPHLAAKHFHRHQGPSRCPFVTTLQLATTNLSCISVILSYQEDYINIIIQCIAFWNWLFLLIMIPLRFIQTIRHETLQIQLLLCVPLSFPSPEDSDQKAQSPCPGWVHRHPPAKHKEWHTVILLVQPHPWPQLASCEATMTSPSRPWSEQKGRAEANPSGWRVWLSKGVRGDGSHVALTQGLERMEAEAKQQSRSMQRMSEHHCRPRAPGGGACTCMCWPWAPGDWNELQAEMYSRMAKNKVFRVMCPGFCLFWFCYLQARLVGETPLRGCSWSAWHRGSARQAFASAGPPLVLSKRSAGVASRVAHVTRKCEFWEQPWHCPHISKPAEP